ncbi:MAG: beta-ketoacyl-[acyl-carrier-protein] synthase family protein [Paludisphaera borealis]|uniref:beta-ketoacyl-[acyl-carrier-protein] synthase family protein n=1 Tax=Paludisphaera borealis TaxID=1387353 RepID=UPI002841868C|nr:beta-ketoacyl-[acyl-carrier-protein] synthase family protein [Paludisphaera borealis]MDR3618151.1 beta-ketoacyl-[acyl-carrier-protein] synthase family protein [Paludisphaera borealis]
MLGSERRVVITGLGFVTPLGDSPDRIWGRLAAGQGALRRVEAFPVAGLPSDVVAEIRDFDFLKGYALPKFRNALRKSRKYMARDILLAVAAAQLAINDAGLVDGGVEPSRIGIDLGAGLISTELDELAPAITMASAGTGSFDFPAWGREAIGVIEPIWLLKYLPNMLACHISILMDCQGPSNTITEADASSNLAIAEASRIIARGKADVMITGGADSKIHPLSLTRMALYGTMSRWEGEPSGACRPFDSRRDGSAPGEGAGILILEEREHALRRGAKIHGEILGSGSGCDAMPTGGMDPDGSGTATAIKAALREARLDPAAIGHVNAHGSGLKLGDRAEARAFHRVFGGSPPPVTGLKGFMGNMASGAGAVELIASLVGVNRGLIPPTLNCDDPDPDCALDVVTGSPRPTDNPIFVNTNLTVNGQAAAVVVRGEAPNVAD